jgi:hypothetical protein
MGKTLELVQNESHETSRTGAFFKCLSPDAMRDFGSFESCFSHPSGVVLFRQDQIASRIFFLLEGRVNLYINSSGGERLNLRIAKPGEIIGLPSALSGDPSEVTAETVHPCRIASLTCPDFLNFLTRHPSCYRSVAKELSLEYNRVCQQLPSVGFGSSSPASVSRLLQWCVDADSLTLPTRTSHFCSANPDGAPATPGAPSVVPRSASRTGRLSSGVRA